MKIIFVTPHFFPHIGGVEKYVFQLAKGLSKEHSVVIVTSGQRGKKEEIDWIEDIKIYRIPYAFRLSNTPINPLWFWKLRRIFKKEQPDVINAHSPVPFMADVAVRAAGEIPVVLTYHAGSMLKGSGLVDGILKLYEGYMLPRLFERVAHVVAIYPDFVRSKIRDVSRMSFIAPGTDVEKFVPSKEPIIKDADVLFVGRIQQTSEWKGLDVLLDAIRLLKARGNYITLKVAGDGDAVAQYQQKAEKMGIIDRVKFVGQMDGDHLVQTYQQAKITVLPSKTEAESFGMVLAEAMACELPVVGSNIGGIPNVIKHEVNGLLVPARDPAALADALERLLRDESLRRAYGSAGRQRVVEQFSLLHQVSANKRLLERTASRAIVHIASNYPPRLGGLENVVAQLASRQYEEGANVQVLTSRLGYDLPFEDTVPVRRLSAAEIAHTPLIRKVLKNLLRLRRTDIVHIHVAQAYVPEVVWFAALIKKFEYIAHVHLDIAPSGVAGILLKIYKPLVLGRVLRRAKFVVVFTPEQKETMVRRYRLDAMRVKIVPNGVGAQFYHKTPREIHTPPRLLFVGRLSVQKNLDQLLKALDGVSENVETHIVGDGDLRQAHEKMSRDLNLKNVHFHGRLDGEPLRAIYHQADFFVLPSEREGMPLVLLEALAMGLPIIGTNVTGIRDVVQHGENGYLVQLNDNNAFRAAIQIAIKDPRVYKKMSAKSLELSRLYTWETVARNFQELYDA